METKKESFVSIMKDKIILTSIESLRQEGLKFSVDTLAGKLNISKKTIYKFFPDKEALALAIYEKYYTDAKQKAQMLIQSNVPSLHSDLLSLYFDSKIMTRRDIFNKYKLNEKLCSYTTEQNNALWETIAASFERDSAQKDMDTLRIIVDGAFEKLCEAQQSPNTVIERLVELL